MPQSGAAETRLERFLDWILVEEGGHSNNPADNGGDTWYGISKAAYPNVNFSNLTEEQGKTLARSFYSRDYYKPLHCDEIVNDAVAWSVFDCGVNSGTGAAAKCLQRAVNHLTGAGLLVDGGIGPKTIIATNKADPEDLCMVMAAFRLMIHVADVSKHPEKREFVAGWTRRTRRTIV